MRFYDFEIEPLKVDDPGETNGEIKVTMSLSGVKNVAIIIASWNAGKTMLDVFKRSEVKAGSLFGVITSLYYSFIRSAVK